MGQAYSLLGVIWSKQDLFHPIEVLTGFNRSCSVSSRYSTVQSTEHLCSCSCLGPWEMLSGALLLVSLCFIVGRSFMVFHHLEMLHGILLLPSQADVLECGITWAAGLHPPWDRLSVLSALNSSRCWLGKKVTLKHAFIAQACFIKYVIYKDATVSSELEVKLCPCFFYRAMLT